MAPHWGQKKRSKGNRQSARPPREGQGPCCKQENPHSTFLQVDLEFLELHNISKEEANTWASMGFKVSQTICWHGLGFNPTTTMTWKCTGLSPGLAMKWLGEDMTLGVSKFMISRVFLKTVGLLTKI